MNPAEEEDDDFKNLPPHLAEQLAKAEKKFNPAPKEQNRFSNFPELAREYIIGTHFTAYRNTISPGTVDPESDFAEYEDAPVLLYSEKNRFSNLCDLAMKSWMPEMSEFLATFLALEQESQTNGRVSEDLEHKGLAFGVQVNADSYVLGYSGPESAIFARKELLLRLILFVSQCLEQAGAAGGSAEALDHVRALLKKAAPDPDQASARGK